MVPKQYHILLSAIILTSVAAASTKLCMAQARPTGSSRLWAEIGTELSVQSQECAGCIRSGNTAGPTIAATLGITLPSGFGVALSGKKFQEFNTEHSQNSKFVLVYGQYTNPKLPMLTLNVGVGRASHDGDPTDSYRNTGSGGVAGIGAALRLPASKRFVFTVKTDVIKSLGGSTNFQPTTFNFGLGINAASPAAWVRQ